jgi:hypothetical protein
LGHGSVGLGNQRKVLLELADHGDVERREDNGDGRLLDASRALGGGGGVGVVLQVEVHADLEEPLHRQQTDRVHSAALHQLVDGGLEVFVRVNGQGEP